MPEETGLHVAVGGRLGHGRLAAEGRGIETAAWEAFEVFVVSLKSLLDLALLFEQLGLAEARLGGRRGERITRRGLIIEFDRAVGFPGVVRLFRFLIERLALAGCVLGVSREHGNVGIRTAGNEEKRGN